MVLSYHLFQKEVSSGGGDRFVLRALPCDHGYIGNLSALANHSTPSKTIGMATGA